ncbi:MAG: tetratricopeptide repeat protein [Bacteroidales bacterium]|jgi:tetratricopeptide (TPR) repeat protein|nr:tetratricopeptide repeat protein [Bacteroidales bacterium]
MKNKIMDWLRADYKRTIFAVLSLALIIALPIMSKDAGMSGDEHFHFKQAENVINFYKTFGKDTSALVGAGAGQVEGFIMKYGQLPDNISCLIASIFNVDDILSVRHSVNSLFGWLGILFAGLLAFRISGNWLAAIITSLLLFLSPRYLGHSFNNLKDVPFAAVMVMGIYYITRFFQTLPKPPLKVVIMLAISIGCALAIRVGGLLLIAYFGLFAILFFIREWIISLRKKGKQPGSTLPVSKLFLKLLNYGIIISLGGYILGILLWPYALVSPVAHVKETFASMSEFESSLRQLFEGTLVWSDSLPWYYTPKYILISIPIAAIAGWLLYPFVGGWKNENRFSTLILYFVFLFPLFWLIYTHANVYGGWRHAMFAYPPMVVAAGLGFNALIEFVKPKVANCVAIALPFLLLIMPAVHIIRNHPYEYIYFNELAGGMKKAYGNYEMDYYYHSTREATKWVIKNAEKSGLETGDKIRVASWHPASVGYFLRNDTARFQNVFLRWYEKGNNDWDYAIFVITGMAPEQITNKAFFPPKNCVHTIKVDGVPVCIILKRTDKSDMLGFKAKEAHQNDSAILYLEKAIALDPANEASLANISEICLQTGQLEKAKTYIDMLIKVSPKYETGNFFLAHYYLMQNKLDDALQVCKQIIKDNFKFRAAYHLTCNVYLRKQDIKSAEKIMLKMIDADQMDEQGMQQLFEIYKNEGIGERAAYKKMMKKFYQSLERRGKKKEAETYREQYNKI